MKYIKKKPNLIILTSLNPQILIANIKKKLTMVAKIQPSSKKISIYPSGATGPKPIILWP